MQVYNPAKVQSLLLHGYKWFRDIQRIPVANCLNQNPTSDTLQCVYNKIFNNDDITCSRQVRQEQTFIHLKVKQQDRTLGSLERIKHL